MTTTEAPPELTWQAGYDQGAIDGRTAAEAEIAQRGADVLVPVPTPWNLVKAGDVMRAPNGALWFVASCHGHPDGTIRPRLLGPGAQTYPRHGVEPVGVHPDERVPILVPMPEHAALSVLRDAFGAQHVRQLREIPT